MTAYADDATPGTSPTSSAWLARPFHFDWARSQDPAAPPMRCRAKDGPDTGDPRGIAYIAFGDPRGSDPVVGVLGAETEVRFVPTRTDFSQKGTLSFRGTGGRP